MKSSFTIVIPNYNGLSLLRRHLPQVVKHSQNAPIIIVDDASGDDSVSWLKRHYPQIKLLVNQKNRGFAQSVNRGVAAAKTPLVFVVNSDVSLHQNSIPPLLRHFNKPQVFAVGCLEQLPQGERGRSRGDFQRGLLIHQAADTSKPGPTLWVFAASGMFRTTHWHQLHGLDPLFKPAYWEDIDLGYRAWKAGYTCIFEPQATVTHQAEQTMNRELSGKKPAYAFKNQLLFYWKNVSSPDLILAHLLWLPYHLVFTTARSRGAFLHGFLLALSQLFQVCRQDPSCPDKLTDRQIITTTSP